MNFDRIALLALATLLVASNCKKADKDAADTSKISSAKDTADFTGKTIENVPYRFKVSQPSEKWKLLDQDSARQITSDAQAALSMDSGLTAVVIVEHVPGMTLEQMGSLILDSMPVEGKVIDQRETEEYVGLAALRYHLTGNVSDIPMEYEGRIFVRDGYAYQVVAFAPQGVALKQDWQSAFAAFTLTEGEIVAVQDDASSPDMIGVGWELKDGVFTSAVSGLRVAPTDGWRAVVGAEARRMNADAEVVLVHQAPDAYFLIIPEKIGNASRENYAKDRIDSTEANLKGDVQRSQTKNELLGKEVDTTILSGGELPWTFLVSVAFEKDWAIQATGWYTAGIGEAGSVAIANAMRSVSLMPASKVDALRSRLLAMPDEQDVVGKDFSLRSGVFQDYAHGVKWTKPKGFWELSVGQEVREINPIAQLYGRYANSALHIMLVAETGESTLDPAAFHDASFAGVQANLKLKRTSGPSKGKIGSGMALVSNAETKTSGIDLNYRVITSVSGSQGLQLHIWGVANSLVEHEEAAQQATKMLEQFARLPATEVRKGVFVDHRMGFSMELDRKYKYTDTTPAALAGIGSYPTWGVDGKDWVGVLAIRAIEAGRDRAWSMDQMEERIRESFTSIVNAGEAKKEEATLLGMPARHLVWKSKGMRLDAYLVLRHQTIYALAATDDGGGTEMIDKAITGFKLVD